MSKSTKWFLVILGIVLVTGLLITVVFVSMIGTIGGGGTETVTTGSGDKIGVVELQGVITSSEDFVRQVKKFREQSSHPCDPHPYRLTGWRGGGEPGDV